MRTAAELRVNAGQRWYVCAVRRMRRRSIEEPLQRKSNHWKCLYVVRSAITASHILSTIATTNTTKTTYTIAISASLCRMLDYIYIYKYVWPLAEVRWSQHNSGNAVSFTHCDGEKFT